MIPVALTVIALTLWVGRQEAAEILALLAEKIWGAK